MPAARKHLSGTDLDFYALASVPQEGHADPSGLPMTVKVLLEGLLRLSEAGTTNEESVRALAAWPAPPPTDAELPLPPPRVFMQAFTRRPARAGPPCTPTAHPAAGE